jgi:hypothetical protein
MAQVGPTHVIGEDDEKIWGTIRSFQWERQQCRQDGNSPRRRFGMPVARSVHSRGNHGGRLAHLAALQSIRARDWSSDAQTESPIANIMLKRIQQCAFRLNLPLKIRFPVATPTSLAGQVTCVSQPDPG